MDKSYDVGAVSRESPVSVEPEEKVHNIHSCKHHEYLPAVLPPIFSVVIGRNQHDDGQYFTAEHQNHRQSPL